MFRQFILGIVVTTIPLFASAATTEIGARVRPQFQAGDYVTSGFDIPLGVVKIEHQVPNSEHHPLKMNLEVGTLDSNATAETRIQYGVREARIFGATSLGDDSQIGLGGGIVGLPAVPWIFYDSPEYPFPSIPRIYEEKLIPSRDMGGYSEFTFHKYFLNLQLMNGQGPQLRNVDNNLMLIGTSGFRSDRTWFSVSGGSGETGVYYAGQKTSYLGVDFVRSSNPWHLEANYAYRNVTGYQPYDSAGGNAGVMLWVVDELLALGARSSYLGATFNRPANISHGLGMRVRSLGLYWNAFAEGYWNSAGNSQGYRYLFSTQWDWKTEL